MRERERERERERLTLGFEDLLSIKILSPIFTPSVAMVTSSVAGEVVREEPLETVEIVETGERAPVRV